jgi:transcriptional regulator with XRE-family HTH domain
VLSETLKRELGRYGVGQKVRALRWQQGLKLAELAARSRLSASLLSKIERGQSVPSLPALQAIATSLDVTLSHFFPKSPRAVPAVTRPGERVRLPELPRRKGSAFDFESLNFAAIEPILNCYWAQFRPSEQSSPHSHEGSEFLFVLTGTLEVTVAGDAHLLDEGDSVYFDSSLPHSYAHAGKRVCSALVVTFPTPPAVAGLDPEGTRDQLHLRSKKIIWTSAG